MSFFVITPPPLWDTRKRVWKIADNAVNLLDIGCGYAHITRSSKARNIVGVDLDRNALKEAYQYGASNFAVVLCDATSLPFKDQAFDVIIATEVLEHLPDDELCIKDIYRVLQSKGVLLIHTPNGDYLTRLLVYHVRHYKQQDLISLLWPFFQLRKTEKRFGVSFLVACRFTTFRLLKKQHVHSNKERINTTSFVLAAPLLIALSPIVNILQVVEDKTGKGKYNLAIECTKL